MIATSKLRHSKAALAAAHRYKDEVLGSLYRLGRFAEAGIPSNSKSDCAAGREVLFVLSSDKGLCGGYNSSITKYFRMIFPDLSRRRVSFCFIGKKVALSSKFLVDTMDVLESEMDFASVIDLITTAGDEVTFSILYTRFFNAMTMHPELLRIPTRDSFIFHESHMCGLEPERDELFAFLYGKYVCAQLYECLKEAKVSENMSRMFAMDAATKNAQDVADDLKRLYNRGRQEKITRELVEVVSGAEVI